MLQNISIPSPPYLQKFALEEGVLPEPSTSRYAVTVFASNLFQVPKMIGRVGFDDICSKLQEYGVTKRVYEFADWILGRSYEIPGSLIDLKLKQQASLAAENTVVPSPFWGMLDSIQVVKQHLEVATHPLLQKVGAMLTFTFDLATSVGEMKWGECRCFDVSLETDYYGRTHTIALIVKKNNDETVDIAICNTGHGLHLHRSEGSDVSRYALVLEKNRIPTHEFIKILRQLVFDKKSCAYKTTVTSFYNAINKCSGSSPKEIEKEQFRCPQLGGNCNMACLAEAVRYILIKLEPAQGRWIYKQFKKEMRYRVLEQLIPAIQDESRDDRAEVWFVAKQVAAKLLKSEKNEEKRALLEELQKGAAPWPSLIDWLRRKKADLDQSVHDWAIWGQKLDALFNQLQTVSGFQPIHLDFGEPALAKQAYEILFGAHSIVNSWAYTFYSGAYTSNILSLHWQLKRLLVKTKQI